MADRSLQRRLAAIIVADVAGYSRLMHDDEDATIAAWHQARDMAIDPAIEDFGGRIVKHTGDGFVAEFATATDALRCALKMQASLADQNADIPPSRRMDFRLGLNIGEITVDAEDIHGDGVNIAARLEAIADPGGICVSAAVYDQVRARVDCAFVDMGDSIVKNISDPVHCYRVELGERRVDAVTSAGAKRRPISRRRRRWIFLSLLALVLIVGWVLIPTAPPPPAGPPTVNVQPFRIIDGADVQRNFSAGLTEDVITALGTSGSVQVVTTLPADQTSMAPAQFVVEGTVRGRDRVRITAQLIDRRSGVHVWAGRYDRQMSDQLAQQAEISAKIATALTSKLQLIDAERRVAADGGDSMEMTISFLSMVGRAAQSAIEMPTAIWRWITSGGRGSGGEQ